MNTLCCIRPLLLWISLTLVFTDGGLYFHRQAKAEAPPVSTLERILQKDEITVITRNNAHCYYFYRDQKMGFEYDLARLFANYLGVRLNIKIAERWEGMIPSLRNHSGDLIAASMTITPARLQEVAFSEGYLTIRQHIIVHRDNRSIKTLADLNQQTVHVRKGTSYQEQLEALQQEGLNLSIVLHDDTPTEDLIKQVNDKKIEITIADSNIAMLNRRYYPRVIIAEAISQKENIGWAVHPDSSILLSQINQFFKLIKETGQLDEIYSRYYTDVEDFDYVDIEKYHKRLKTRLPRYKAFIKDASAANGFDWRLIAAQVYQESHFNPRAKSHAGAYGLMQLTRNTARSLGVEQIYDPEENIHAGTRHLRNLYDHFAVPNEEDRLFIALAAYNIGQGHLRDAQKLAVKLDLDPDSWASITQTLPLLRLRKYYKDATYGYCRGTEPIDYVKQIMIYYDILKRQAIEYHQHKSKSGKPSAESTPSD